MLMGDPLLEKSKTNFRDAITQGMGAGLPVGVHVFGYRGRAASNTGWPSFYIE